MSNAHINVAKPLNETFEKVFCATCVHYTNHALLHRHMTNWGDEDIWGHATHDYMRCNGCEMPTYRCTSWSSEDPGDYVSYYPARPSEGQREPKRFIHLPWGGPIESVYRQTLAAFNSRLMTLAGAGVRLVIEGVCSERNIKNGIVVDGKGKSKRSRNLDGKINGLAENDLISKAQAEALHQIRFLGNDAAHELYQPSIETVAIALDIVEHLLEHVYEQPEKTKALAARKRGKK